MVNFHSPHSVGDDGSSTQQLNSAIHIFNSHMCAPRPPQPIVRMACATHHWRNPFQLCNFVLSNGQKKNTEIMEMSYWRNTIRKCVLDGVFESEGIERTHYGQSLKLEFMFVGVLRRIWRGETFGIHTFATQRTWTCVHVSKNDAFA